MNGVRYFQRLEDYRPRTVRNANVWALFDVSCVKCGSVNLKFISVHDNDLGETVIYLLCPRCRQRQRVKT